jgi:pimeloyl-ACP methyl ester carboxylesterase
VSTARDRQAISRLRVNDLEVGLIEAGTGPLALCLHGFPDSPHTWRHLLPALADAGFHAVAPFMRGYAPTEVPRDGCLSRTALVADAVALHEALGGDEQAVLIGHDWGAAVGYTAGAYAPDRWRRIVTMAIPPPPIDAAFFAEYEQIKRFFYLFLFQTSIAEHVVAAGDLAFLDRLWQEWSPGYDAAEDLAQVKEYLREPAHLSAALGWYRSILQPDAVTCSSYQAVESALGARAPQPTLYLHGAEDRCIGIEIVSDSERHLAPGSRMVTVEQAGHFLHLERPDEVGAQILEWITA